MVSKMCRPAVRNAGDGSLEVKKAIKGGRNLRFMLLCQRSILECDREAGEQN